jgi:hypothetical protein
MTSLAGRTAVLLFGALALGACGGHRGGEFDEDGLRAWLSAHPGTVSESNWAKFIDVIRGTCHEDQTTFDYYVALSLDRGNDLGPELAACPTRTSAVLTRLGRTP